MIDYKLQYKLVYDRLSTWSNFIIFYFESIDFPMLCKFNESQLIPNKNEWFIETTNAKNYKFIVSKFV